MWKDTSYDVPRKVAVSGASSRSASRRKRTSFSKEHVELLRTTFETDPYPGISLRESLSQTSGLPESRIQVWFQNRRARTLKCKGAKKALWQSESPAQHSLPQSHTMAMGGTGAQPGLAPLPSICLPPAYPAQVKEEMEEDCFYRHCPPYYTAAKDTAHCTSLVGFDQGRLLDTSTNPPFLKSPGHHQMVPGSWAQTGEQMCPEQSLWNPSPLEVRNYSSGSSQAFVYPASTEQQPLYVPCGFQAACGGGPLSQTCAPAASASPDCWEVGQENTPPTEAQCSQLDGTWSTVTPELCGMSSQPGHQGQSLHHAPLPELPALSLQEILGELEGGWWEADRPDSHAT